jgi:uncharacterized protein YdeI (YjbR/CyaY-like superfamily)
MVGYSGTPLPQKLGIKEGHRIGLIDAPEDFAETLGKLPAAVELFSSLGNAQVDFDILLYFATEQAGLEKRLAGIIKHLDPNGGLWVAWPKAASGVRTNVNANTVRAVALAAGLVDNKICAIDDTWSGLRCVIRVKDRPKPRIQVSVVPEELAVALSKSRKAKTVFEAMPLSHQKEWIAHIQEAKRPETREKRAQEAVRRLAQGK